MATPAKSTHRFILVILAGLVAAGLLGEVRAESQSVGVSAGTSSFLDASGVELDYKLAPFSGNFGVGFSNGLEIGGFLGTTYRGTGVAIGDRLYPFVLDTDVLDRSHYFNGRGLSVSRHSDQQSWLLFAGTSATEFFTPFLHAFQRGQTTGAFFYERKFSPRIVFHSFNILDNQVTSIQSVGITLQPRWKVDVAGGVGANNGYLAAATEYEHGWFDLAGSYTIAGDRFQRIRITSPVLSEPRGANLRLRLTPFSHLGFELDHRNFLSPIFTSTAPLRATLDSANAFGSFQGFTMNAGISVSHAGAFVTRAQILSVSRHLGQRFTGCGALLRTETQNGKPVSVYLGTMEERISPRLYIEQTLTRANGSTTFSGGGRFLSNPFSVGIHYQTLFTPVAGGFNGRPFVQAWTVNLQIQIPRGRGAQLHYDNFVDPFGKVRYTAFVSGIGYGGFEASLGYPPASAPPISRYLVQGRTEDESGKPVWGVAIEIDGQVLFSNNRGEFFVRLKRPGAYSLTFAAERSLSPGRWEIVSAPRTVVAETESKAAPVKIVVRRTAASRSPAGTAGTR